VDRARGDLCTAISQGLYGRGKGQEGYYKPCSAKICTLRDLSGKATICAKNSRKTVFAIFDELAKMELLFCSYYDVK